MKPLYSLFFFLFFLAACSDEERPVQLPGRPSETVFADYRVWADEGSGEVTVRVMFRRGDEDAAVAVGKTGNVWLDGEELPADSTRFTGVYYEVSKPVETFSGKHSIVFIDEKKRKFREDFRFEPFSLAGELPESIRKKPFHITLDGLPEAPTTILLVMVDTSLNSADVNEELVIENGVIEVTGAFLDNLTEGPVFLEIYREEEWRIGNGQGKKGKFTMSYGLKRQFNLVK